MRRVQRARKRQEPIAVRYGWAESDEVRVNLDLPLYDYQLLDSTKTVELMIMIEQEFGVRVSPAEFERENWKTPRKIIADIKRRIDA